MYCHQCVRSYADDAKYCSQCGRRLHSHKVLQQGDWTEADAEGAAAMELLPTNHYFAQAGSSPKTETPRTGWLLPAALVGASVATALSVYWYYGHEKQINEDVLQLQAEARTAALGGDFEQALELLSDASEARPEYAALSADMNIIQHAMQVRRLTEQVEVSLSTGMILDAEKGINELKSEFNGHKEPIYDKLKLRMDELNMNLTLQKLTSELETLTTVKEHGEMLNVVNGLIGEEAEALREQIKSAIVSMTEADVDALLAKKNYSGAEQKVNEGLAWLKDDASLIKLRERIQSERSQYEQQEQQRIEQAMQRAAEEDLINQTAAVEVVSTDQTLDEFGDLTVVGVLRNAATRPIYSVTVDFTVQSQDGEVLGKGTANATPNYIEPGEQMTFTATIYGIYDEECEIVVDNATWYLD
ncbi:zinc ribbon domain-containing protein [Paenibacillus nanensis]|uniref:Zinc ribbon domain-containing protein n=1 Tax=Paenibacillus nanensis TaxID=393251 RepID=A0A3A1VHN3_9BACL|nr:FxLYD domain-containing protein [Paenibacillus nanensis]RIX60438.1 zinc ribbon domain-containing protein [Paenibacillus nanensis]